MKTVGIAMLFGLCTLIGARLATKKTERLKSLRTMQKELQWFRERISTGSGTLKNAAREQGILFGILTVYLDALEKGEAESAAAERATEAMHGGEAERMGMKAFLTGLSAAVRADLIQRTQKLLETLERAEAQAEAESKQARVIRVSGALIGAGIAILLL